MEFASSQSDMQEIGSDRKGVGLTVLRERSGYASVFKKTFVGSMYQLRNFIDLQEIAIKLPSYFKNYTINQQNNASLQ